MSLSTSFVRERALDEEAIVFHYVIYPVEWTISLSNVDHLFSFENFSSLTENATTGKHRRDTSTHSTENNVSPTQENGVGGLLVET